MTVFSHHDYDTTISKYAMEIGNGWSLILEYYQLIIGLSRSIVSTIDAR